MPHAHAGAGESVNLETARRVRYVEELLALQYTGKQIIQATCDQFEVVERTAYSYLKIAYENLQPASDEERAMRRTLARSSWQAQFRRANTSGDLGAANYALDRLCKLDGVYEPTKIQIDHTGGLGAVALSIDAVIGVLDSAGLAALDIVLEQLEAAKARGQLKDPEPVPALPPGIDPDAVIDLDDPKPTPPAKPRGRKSRRKS